MSQNVEILYPHTYSINFPSKIEAEIVRDNFIHTVKDLFEQGNSLVIISGDDESGKSTFLSQFAKKYPADTIACFIKPTNKFTSGIETIIFDITSQIHFLLYGEEQPIDIVLNLQTLIDYANKLIRYTKGRRTIYLIFDGLENIENGECVHIKSILDILPIGLPNFKFIFSDYKNKTYDEFLDAFVKKGKLKHSPFTLAGFGLSDIEKFLADLKLDTHQLQEILKISNQLPGRIKNIKEILKGGVTFDELLNQIDKYSDILDFQWNSIDHDNKDLILLISVIALEDKSYSIESLSKFTKLTTEKIKELLSSLSFIEVVGNDEIVCFKSITIKRNFRERLSRYKLKVEEAIVNYLLEDSSSIESIIELPKRLDKSNKFEDLLKFLSEENFSKIIEKKESLTFIEEQTEIGVRAATELKKYPELFRLSIGKSSISELKQSFIWETEIESKIELKQFDKAYSLAQESLLKEDKFKLLAFLTRKLKEKGLTIDMEITSTIKLLYEQINPSSYADSDEIIEIASNLLYNYPDLAIEFLEKASGTSEKSNSDLGLARLAMLIKSISNNSEEGSERIQTISSRIKNPKLKNLTTAFGFLYNNDDVEKFLIQLKDISSPSDQLQTARIYLQENRKAKNLHLVIDYAIDLVLASSTDNPISAATLSELSEPLPSIDDLGILDGLVQRFEPLFQTAKEKGPTLSNIKFRLNTAGANLKIDVKKGINSFIDVDTEISEIKDLGIKTDCYSIFYSRIKQFDKSGLLEIENKFESNTLKVISDHFDILLSETAQHYKVSRRIIREISKVNPHKGIEFAKKLNIQYSRDQGLLTGIKSYLKNDFDSIDATIVSNFVTPIVEDKMRNEVILELLWKYSKYEGDVLAKFPFLYAYCSEIKNFFTTRDRCLAYSFMLSIIAKSSYAETFFQTLTLEIKDFIENLNDKFDRIDFGFKLSTCFLPISKELAAEYHDLAVQQRELLDFESPIPLTLFYNSLRLSIQSFAGLFKANTHKNDDVQKLIEYIKFLPDPSGQTRLFSYLILKVYDKNRIELFNTLYEQTISPIANSIITEKDPFSRGERFNIIENISPITYLYKRELFNELLKKCEASYRDNCVDSVCNYLVSKRIPDEIYDHEDSNYKIDSEDILSILSLIEMLTIDFRIFDKLRELKACFKNNCFPKDIIPVITKKLNEIIQSKLPDPSNITHNGYKILCQAYVYVIEKNREESKWNTLFNDAKGIPNTADRAFVLSFLANLVPEGYRTLSKAVILNETLSNLDNIHSYTARVERYADLKKSIKDVGLLECKTKLKTAIQDSVYENNNELFESQKSIIDFAYDLDPNYAEELIKIIDDDPARKPISSRLRKRLKTNQLKKDLFEDKLEIEAQEVKQLSSICTAFLGKLNSRRVASKHLERTSKWLSSSHKLPISEVYGIYSAFIENANIRWEGAPNEVKNILQPLFDYSIKNVQMVKILAIRSKGKKVTSKEIIFSKSDKQIIVEPGDREKALEFIRKWLREEAVEYVKICDPYFKSDDLELLKEILMVKPDLKVSILAQKENTDSGDLTSVYEKKWDEICDQDPPETKIVIVGYREGGSSGGKLISPNHDRWYITYNSGLRVGTSFNSLGITKNSEITIMNSAEAKNIEDTIIDKYLNQTETTHLGYRLRYMNFTL